MNQIALKEDEKKYLVDIKAKNEPWEKEMLICQWYVEQSYNYEKKYKLIFDFISMKVRYVIVEKERTSITESNKTVTYLGLETLKLESLFGLPYIEKRRSIKGDAHLDKFVNSNKVCEYLLEIEKPSSLRLVAEHIVVSTDVSHDVAYRNINMAIPFEKQHLTQLRHLLRVWQ